MLMPGSSTSRPLDVDFATTQAQYTRHQFIAGTSTQIPLHQLLELKIRVGRGHDHLHPQLAELDSFLQLRSVTTDQGKLIRGDAERRQIRAGIRRQCQHLR